MHKTPDIHASNALRAILEGNKNASPFANNEGKHAYNILVESQSTGQRKKHRPSPRVAKTAERAQQEFFKTCQSQQDIHRGRFSSTSAPRGGRPGEAAVYRGNLVPSEPISNVRPAKKRKSGSNARSATRYNYSKGQGGGANPGRPPTSNLHHKSVKNARLATQPLAQPTTVISALLQTPNPHSGRSKQALSQDASLKQLTALVQSHSAMQQYRESSKAADSRRGQAVSAPFFASQCSVP